MPTTFLFTDIAGSTRLWQEHPDAMGAALAIHDRVIGEAVAACGGSVFKHTGDGVAAVFDDPASAVEAAGRIQLGIGGTSLDEVGPLSVRIGIHTGEAEQRDGDYFGLAVSRTARLMDAGHGGQVLCSADTGELVASRGVTLLDLGEHRLRDLTGAERIYQVAVDGDAGDFPRLRTLDAAPNNLPHFPTSFVGREEEQEELAGLVAGSQMVTITGVGGAGKTRLALQVAAGLVPRFSDGVWLVELATVTDPESLDAAVVAALGLGQPTGAEPRQVVLDHLAGRDALLVVDNCEHLIDEAASLVDDILTIAPDVKVVATSRELLGISGEMSYRLRSLAVPAREVRDPEAVRSADAVQLFMERATAGRPDFTLTDDNAATVAEVCRRLDGMPLAIELAAARVRSFSVDQIATRLDQRFRLLTGGARTALPRQQTLTAAIDWSYRLLGEAEKALFRRLSVFSGGFDFDAAEAVCPGDPVDEMDVLDLLPALVDKSLVVAEETGGIVRYRLLETLRQYGRDRLDEEGDADAWRRRHAEHYARLSNVDVRRRMHGPDGPVLRQAIRMEMSNLRQGMGWALGAGERDLGLDLLYPFARISGMDGQWSELLSWCEAFAELIDETAPLHRQAEWLLSYGSVLFNRGDQKAAADRLQESADIFRHLDGEGADAETLAELPRAINNLSLVLLYSGQGGDRNEHYTELQYEVLEAARRLDADFWEATALANLAHHRDPGGDPAEARKLFEEAEEAAHGIGSDRLAGLADQRAFFEFSQGEIDEACRQWAEAARLADEIGDGGSVVRSRLAWAAGQVELGDLEAEAAFRDAVAEMLSDPEVSKAMTYHHLALAFGTGVDAIAGRWERVAAADGVSETLTKRRLTLRWDMVDYFNRKIEEARSQFGDAAFQEARSRGAALTDEEITDFLLEGVT